MSPIESSESVGPALFNDLSGRDLIQLECLQDNKTIVDLDRLLYFPLTDSRHVHCQMGEPPGNECYRLMMTGSAKTNTRGRQTKLHFQYITTTEEFHSCPRYIHTYELRDA